MIIKQTLYQTITNNLWGIKGKNLTLPQLDPKALVAFCFAVFVFAILSNSNHPSAEILRYIILGGVVLLLLFYNYTLDQYGNQNGSSDAERQIDSYQLNDNIELHYAKGLYDELQSLRIYDVSEEDGSIFLNL